MKRFALLIMCLMLFEVTNAQQEKELDPEFKIEGLAMSVFKGDKVSKEDISAKTWILEGKVVDGKNTVSFRAYDKKNWRIDR